MCARCSCCASFNNKNTCMCRRGAQSSIHIPPITNERPGENAHRNVVAVPPQRRSKIKKQDVLARRQTYNRLSRARRLAQTFSDHRATHAPHTHSRQAPLSSSGPQNNPPRSQPRRHTALGLVCEAPLLPPATTESIVDPTTHNVGPGPDRQRTTILSCAESCMIAHMSKFHHHPHLINISLPTCGTRVYARRCHQARNWL
jgi:hypothetical protein